MPACAHMEMYAGADSAKLICFVMDMNPINFSKYQSILQSNYPGWYQEFMRDPSYPGEDSCSYQT